MGDAPHIPWYAWLPGSGLQRWLAVALAAVATLLLGSLVPFLAAGQPQAAPFPLTLLYAPAWFLFDAFFWLALLIPALCYTYVYVLLSHRASRELVAVLIPAGLIILTLSTLIHVVDGGPGGTAPVAAALLRFFGRIPALILLGLAALLEGIAILALFARRSRHRSGEPLQLAPPQRAADHPAPAPADRDQAAAYPSPAANHPAPPPVSAAAVATHQAAAAATDVGQPVRHPATDDADGADQRVLDPAAATAATAAAAAGTISPTGTLAVHEAQPPQAPRAPGAPGPAANLPAADSPPASQTTGAERTPVSRAASAAVRPPRARRRGYQVPLDVLDVYDTDQPGQVEQDTREAAAILMATLAEFKIDADVTGIRRGPVITMFEILPAPGVKISRIVNLADNIALRLAASRVRIVAPIPGKHAVGIEVPNRRRSIVSFREIVSLPQFKPAPKEPSAGIPIVLGKDITGEAQVVDLTATPHLLIAGATGSGKSVLVNSLICSILYARTQHQVRLLLIDPKIVELKFYNDVPHLLTPVITDPKRAFQALQYCLYEMDRRYALLDALGVRDINSFNRKVSNQSEQLTTGPLPYLVIVIDEFADLMATTGKELESTLARLAAMSRAVGIHIVLATQRPSIDVITGLIKANIPSRIAFMVAGKFDSRIIIDAVGAEKLLGRGDMLFVPAWDANPVRIQGAFLSEDEVERVTAQVRELGEPDYIDEDLLFDEEASVVLEPGGDDPLMDEALAVVRAAGKASASYLQRKLKIGYNRAARMVEEMEQRGIVGPAYGSKPRELLHIPSRD